MSIIVKFKSQSRVGKHRRKVSGAVTRQNLFVKKKGSGSYTAPLFPNAHWKGFLGSAATVPMILTLKDSLPLSDDIDTISGRGLGLFLDAFLKRVRDCLSLWCRLEEGSKIFFEGEGG